MKILIVSHCYCATLSVGAKRIVALKKFLESEGFHVDVITANWQGKRDPNVVYLGEDIPVKVKNRKSRVPLSGYMRTIDKTLFSKFFYRAIKLIYLKRNIKYDLIIASYKPAASIFLGVFASFVYKASLVIELRDLMSKFGRKRKLFFVDRIDQFLDKKIVTLADEIVVVSPTQKKYAQDFYQRKINLVFNGTDPAELTAGGAKKIDSSTSIFYSGTLSDHRKLNAVCKHIKNLKGEKKVILRVASAQNPMEYGADPNFTEWLGLVSLRKVYVYQMEADFLLILEGMGQDSVENIPAKIYEYLGARKPIMAFCNANSDIVSILKETKRGSDVVRFDRFCKELELTRELLNEDIVKYTRKFQNAQYLKVINNVIDGTG